MKNPPVDLKARTKKFALDVIDLVESLPRTKKMEVIGMQLLRSATSVGANYRTVCRARSHADFVSKIGLVEEEADESVFWLEMLRDSRATDDPQLSRLLLEADELTAIFAASGRTAKQTFERFYKRGVPT